MHLEKYSVRGFRSLSNVADIPVGKPTILAGPNDGGKTSALHALQFLLGDFTVTHDDRTRKAGQADDALPLIDVEGSFRLDDWEQEHLDLPAQIRLRRVIDSDLQHRYEMWAPVPDDAELHDLASKNVVELKELNRQFGLTPEKQTRQFLLSALQDYADEHSSESGWCGARADVVKRLPRITTFDGQSLEPEAAVRSVLNLRLKAHAADENVRPRVHALEEEFQDWLRREAKPLEDHIVSRCKDIESVSIGPEVSFTPTLKNAPVRIQRKSGEHVRLDRSGLGSARRVSIAVWEATSDVLAEDAQGLADGEAPPVQVVVVYDEPDTHLDYHFQREIMRLIREQSNMSHVSVVVATHSMNLIDGVDIRDVVLLRTDEQYLTVLQRLGSGSHADFDIHLGRIATAVGLRNSVLLHERCFFAVEGDSEQQAIPLLFQLAEGMSLQAAGVALWACGGNDGALSLAKYLSSHDRSVLLMIDADSPAEKKIFNTERLKRTFLDRYDEIVVMLGKAQGVNELEELFGDELWADVANAKWPRPAGWVPEDFAAHRSGKKFSAKVERMLQEHGTPRPSGKPEIMMMLASHLERPEQVPAALRAVFARVRDLAG